ncbi:MAG: hypothetical protein OXC01_04330 [Immundisolibacterales bacterium]|nr:hypothetical protein [Immundisolibacterales bacterium]
MNVFLAHFLFVLAAWTVVIKYLFPVAYAIAHGLPPATHVYLDFWPVAHVWLGWALLARPRFTYLLALAVSLLEIGIVTTKFTLFLLAPEWTIWTTNWFVNKLFVLSCFVLMLAHLLVRRNDYAPHVALARGRKEAGAVVRSGDR